jgi:hypothetical protein
VTLADALRLLRIDIDEVEREPERESERRTRPGGAPPRPPGTCSVLLFSSGDDFDTSCELSVRDTSRGVVNALY